MEVGLIIAIGSLVIVTTFVGVGMIVVLVCYIVPQK